MNQYTYQEDSGAGRDFSAPSMDGACEQAERWLGESVMTQLAAIRDAGKAVEFPVTVTADVAVVLADGGIDGSMRKRVEVTIPSMPGVRAIRWDPRQGWLEAPALS